MWTPNQEGGMLSHASSGHPYIIMKWHSLTPVCPGSGFGPRSVWLQSPWSFQGNILPSVSKPYYIPNVAHWTLYKRLLVTYRHLAHLLLAPHGAVWSHFLSLSGHKVLEFYFWDQLNFVFCQYPFSLLSGMLVSGIWLFKTLFHYLLSAWLHLSTPHFFIQ